MLMNSPRNESHVTRVINQTTTNNDRTANNIFTFYGLNQMWVKPD